MSDEFPVDGENFHVEYPCYVIVFPPFHISEDGEIDFDQTGRFLSTLHQGVRVTPVFTDQDLAMRFAKLHRLPGSVVIAEVKVPATLASILQRMRHKDGQRVSVLFDVGERFPGFLIHFRDMPGTSDTEP